MSLVCRNASNLCLICFLPNIASGCRVCSALPFLFFQCKYVAAHWQTSSCLQLKFTHFDCVMMYVYCTRGISNIYSRKAVSFQFLEVFFFSLWPAVQGPLGLSSDSLMMSAECTKPWNHCNLLSLTCAIRSDHVCARLLCCLHTTLVHIAGRDHFSVTSTFGPSLKSPARSIHRKVCLADFCERKVQKSSFLTAGETFFFLVCFHRFHLTAVRS